MKYIYIYVYVFFYLSLLLKIIKEFVVYVYGFPRVIDL